LGSAVRKLFHVLKKIME